MSFIYKNLITYAGAKDYMEPHVTDIIDQGELSYELGNDICKYMGFTETRALSPQERYGIKIGAYEIEEVTEGSSLPIIKIGRGAEKGFTIREFGGRIVMTDLVVAWLKSAKTLEGADSSVKKEFANLMDQTKLLVDGSVKKLNQECTKIFTKGFAVTADAGPGSMTPYGKALFASDHPYGDGENAGTFQNVLGGDYGTLNGVLNETNLQAMVNAAKSSIRLQNGDRVAKPSTWVLMCSTTGSVTAGKILNTAGQLVGTYSGAGENAMQLNQFSFEGNKVAILENPYLGSLDASGNAIGSDKEYYLINMEGVEKAKALKKISLQDQEVMSWFDPNTNTSYTDIRAKWAVEHVGAEYFVVGSKGTAS